MCVQKFMSVGPTVQTDRHTSSANTWGNHFLFTCAWYSCNFDQGYFDHDMVWANQALAIWPLENT